MGVGIAWLQEHHVRLRIGHRAVPHPSRDHEQFAGAQDDVMAVLEVNPELAGRDEEELIGLVVLVPHELALDFDHDDLERGGRGAV